MSCPLFFASSAAPVGSIPIVTAFSFLNLLSRAPSLQPTSSTTLFLYVFTNFFVSLTNPGPVISTGAKQFYFTSSSQPDAVGTCTIVSRSVDIDDDGFASADNDYVAFIAIR